MNLLEKVREYLVMKYSLTFRCCYGFICTALTSEYFKCDRHVIFLVFFI